MNRALRAATMGVLLFSPLALSACSAGQVTQTATQERDKTGAQAQVGDISLRQVQLVHPRGDRYEQGDDADLQAAVVNAGRQADTLVRISGEGFDSADFTSSGTSASSSTGSSTSASPSTDAGTSASPSTETSSPSTTPGTSPSTGSAGSGQGIEIPAGSSVFLGDGQYAVTLTNLHESLTTGQYLDITFTFKNAGDVTIPVTVAAPAASGTRGKAFDFHEKAGSEGH